MSRAGAAAAAAPAPLRRTGGGVQGVPFGAALLALPALALLLLAGAAVADSAAEREPRTRVDEIFGRAYEQGLIERVRPTTDGSFTNYYDLILQEASDAPLPALVFHADSDVEDHACYANLLEDAKLFRSLSDQYRGRVRFVLLDIATSHPSGTNAGQHYCPGDRPSLSPALSMVMYSKRVAFVRREDGVRAQLSWPLRPIDSLAAGDAFPGTQEARLGVLRRWIDTNLFRASNDPDEVVCRFAATRTCSEQRLIDAEGMVDLSAR